MRIRSSTHCAHARVRRRSHCSGAPPRSARRGTSPCCTFPNHGTSTSSRPLSKTRSRSWVAHGPRTDRSSVLDSAAPSCTTCWTAALHGRYRHEYELKAALENTFTKLGGSRPAYGSIVGAGQRGTQLHYMLDSGTARPGDLVVMDAATEYQGYAADITRTIPVSGKFTADQRIIYQLVRDAQAAAERNSRPGMSAAAATDS